MRKFAAISLLAFGVAGAVSVVPVMAQDKPVIAFANSYYGNTMRHQQVEAFTAAAEQAKSAGRISDYVVLNGDGTVPAQVAHFNDLTLRGVDAIVTILASEAALNGSITKACDAGIKVVTLEVPPTVDCPTKLNIDFAGNSAIAADKAMEVAEGKGNVLVVRGIKGAGNDEKAYNGQMEALKKYPDAKVVGEIYGNWSGPEAQAAVTAALPGLPKVDVVFAQGGGDGYGVLQAFLQSPDYANDMPIIIGGNESDFVMWWQEAKKANNYATVSVGPNPSQAAAAFWVALNLVEGAEVPAVVDVPETFITNDNLAEFGDLQPNQIVSAPWDEAWTKANMLQQ
jgi:ribose transport system substrate-binding protein